MLGQRALNRALLERQLLLRRASMAPLQAIAHLAGMQAQAPNAPYVGLWTRLAGFRPAELADLMTERAVVRTHLMRNTVHLVTADDCLAAKGLFRAGSARDFASSPFARNVADIDLRAVVDAGRALLAERPRTRGELGRLLAGRWPGRDPASLAYAVTYHVPTVQVPPRGIWGSAGPAAFTTTEAWLGGDPPPPGAGADGLVLRYLAAFGPATVQDAATWSGLAGLREVAERLRPRLRAFRDADGRELLDLPDGPPAGPGHAGAAAVPARVRQPPALPRRPRPGHPGPPQRAAAPGRGRDLRHPAGRRVLAGHLEDHARAGGRGQGQARGRRRAAADRAVHPADPPANRLSDRGRRPAAGLRRGGRGYP